METRITVNGKTWIVPTGNTQALVSWLRSNAVEVGARQEIREIRNDNATDQRQLITEKL